MRTQSIGWFASFPINSSKPCSREELTIVPSCTASLFGKWQEKEKKFGEDSITVIFDVDEDDLPVVCVRMASDEMKKYINDRLFSTQGASGGALSDTKGKADAFGVAGTLAEKHPQPNLPILGPSYLMSMNKDTPCHRRYGHIGSAIFSRFPKRLRTPQAMLCNTLPKSRIKEKTWVPRGKRETTLCHLENMIDSDAYVASTLGTGDEGKDLEDYAKTVYEMLRLKLPNQETSYIRLLLLQSVNKGQMRRAIWNRLYGQRTWWSCSFLGAMPPVTFPFTCHWQQKKGK